MREFSVLLIIFCFGCDTEDEYVAPEVPGGATIIAIGDSVMAWNREDEAAIANVVGEELGRVVHDASVSGAYLIDHEGIGGMDIRGQYVRGDWDWIIIDGGGNDLNDRCACSDCDETMDAMISQDGQSGALPVFVRDVVEQEVSVVLVGYYNIPSTGDYGFADCNDWVKTHTQRLKALADSIGTVWLMDASELFATDDLDAYDDDHVHPSPAGSRLIGEAVANQILAAKQ